MRSDKTERPQDKNDNHKSRGHCFGRVHAYILCRNRTCGGGHRYANCYRKAK